MQDQLERLAALGIQRVEALEMAHFVVVSRDRFAALLEHRNGRIVRIGTAGIVTEQGLGMLLWRGEEARVVGKGMDRVASREEVESLRRFSSDIQTVFQV